MNDRGAAPVPWGSATASADAVRPSWATRPAREPSIRPSPISGEHRFAIAPVPSALPDPEPEPAPRSVRPASRGGLSLVPSPRETLPPSSRRPDSLHARVQTLGDALSEARSEAARLRAELELARRAFAAQASTFEAEKQALLATAEDELVKLAMAVAERVVLREVSVEPALVVSWAEEAIAASGFGSGVVIALATDLAAQLDASAWGELADRVVADVALAPGSCELRDGARSVDAGALARLEVVGETLRETGTG